MSKNSSLVIADARVIAGSGGGPEKTILNSHRFLAPAGYTNLCVYLRDPNDPGFASVQQRAQNLGTPLCAIDDRGALDLSVPWALLDLCRRERVAIWHGHDYKTNLLGLFLQRFWPMKLVTTMHGWVQQTTRTPYYYAIDRWCLPHYEEVIAVSPDLHEVALSCGVAASRCHLIENGIDHQQFQRSRTVAEAKTRLGTAADRWVIGAVGRLSAEKGFDLLLRAVAELPSYGIDAEVWILGSGDERANLERLASDLRISSRVRFWGFQSDPREFYEAMDVYALSSLREGLPNVLLEAMAYEVPVVATRIAGVPRLVEDGENGLLISPNNLVELCDSLVRLWREPSLRARLALAGRQTIIQRYSFAARMDRVREIYDRMMSAPRRG
jgi:glycosyltransferase involved in cell wall biosynthesis